jgi:predicted amidohydrolase YtcJ
MLAPGKRADLAVLSGNPLAVPPDRIAALRVLRTVSGGRITYDSEGASR